MGNVPFWAFQRVAQYHDDDADADDNADADADADADVDVACRSGGCI